MTILFWIVVMLTAFWIYELIINIIFWVGEEGNRVFPWKGISIVIFHVITIILLYLPNLNLTPL